MIYQCDACKRTYEFGNNSICCLFCGREQARPATAEEIRAFREAKSFVREEPGRE